MTLFPLSSNKLVICNSDAMLTTKNLNLYMLSFLSLKKNTVLTYKLARKEFISAVQSLYYSNHTCFLPLPLGNFFWLYTKQGNFEIPIISNLERNTEV